MTGSQGPHGPFETDAQVLAVPDVEAVFEAARESNRHGVLREGGEAILRSACQDAGVELGAYDASMIRWLADFGPKGCEVFADLIRQAAHGKPGPHTVVFDLVDGNNTLFVLTEALTGFRGDQHELAAGSGDSARDVWAGRATDMLAQVDAAMQEDQ